MLPRKKFLILRHGETVANAQGVASGSVDTPLTENGKSQAAQARIILEKLSYTPDYIVHSALSRARDTANIINDNMKLPLFEDARLNERDFGVWQGQPWHEVRQLRDAGVTPENGETRDEFYTRALTGIKNALEQNSGMPFIVTHGGVFDALWHSLKLDTIKAHNCCLYELIPADAAWQFIHHSG